MAREEEFDLARRRLQPFLEHAYLLDGKQLDRLAKLDDIEAKVSFLKKALNFKNMPSPLRNINLESPEKAGEDLLRKLRNPDYFPYTCKLLFGYDIMPFQHIALKEMWTKPFPMMIFTRGGGKSFLLGLYAMLRLLFNPNCKIAIVAKTFRQAKGIFEYMETFWYKGDIYRDICGVERNSSGREQGPRRGIDRCEMIVGNSVATAIPLGDGSGVRGQRAHYLLTDEFAEVPEEIFNDAVFGFASVSAAPAEKVQRMAKIKLLKAAGVLSKEQEEKLQKTNMGNQVVLSGTADYTFGHFYKTYDLYRKIIKSGNDEMKLKDALGDKFNTGMRAEDCSIMRFPATLLPEGFMDPKIIGVAKAKLPASVYQKEYDATFPDDSEGFFKMSLVRSACCPIKTQDGDINFSPVLYGDKSIKYVLAIDPASENDRLAVTILECHPSHRRLVYVWTIKRKEHKERVNRGIVKENEYYKFCADKIRELMVKFNVVEIACDAAGGGIAIEEALANPNKESGLLPIYRVKDPPGTNDPKPTDKMQGLHILHMIQFSKAIWVSEANHALRADLESKSLIFPYYDLVSEALSIEEDKRENRVIIDNKNNEIRLVDSLTSNLEEIEELKKELASIAYSKTQTGREKWDLPKIKGPDGKFITETKDRYSSILMCNSIGRVITANDAKPPKQERSIYGGLAYNMKDSKAEGDFHLNKPHWVRGTTGYGIVKKAKKK